MKFLKLFLVIFAFGFIKSLAQPKIEIVGGNEHNWGKINASVGKVTTKIKIKNIMYYHCFRIS